MKRLAIATAIGSLVACGGCGSSTAPTPPANIAGPYDVTITASSTCSANLPPAAWVLAFSASVTQTGAAAQMELVAHLPGLPTSTVSGTVSGQTINFPSLSLNETMGRGATLVASANANVAANGDIVGSLSGTYQTPSGSCNAANHQLKLVKLCNKQISPGVIAAVPCGT
jgi:hypothetical protein